MDHTKMEMLDDVDPSEQVIEEFIIEVLFL